jgi:hypothetical protein
LAALFHGSVFFHVIYFLGRRLVLFSQPPPLIFVFGCIELMDYSFKKASSEE